MSYDNIYAKKSRDLLVIERILTILVIRLHDYERLGKIHKTFLEYHF